MSNMKLINFLKMNDWKINKFLTFIFTVQISLLSLIGLEFIGLKIPVLRELIALIYLLFVPGILIIRVLRLHGISSIETLLFSVGLSLATLMFIGCFLNAVYIFLGIPRPLSLFPLIIVLSVFVLIMSIVSYLIDNNFSVDNYIDLKVIVSNQSLFLCILPLLSVLGSLTFYFYNENIFFILMMILVGLTIFLVGFKKFITPEYYPLAILMISISLLLHTWLLSPYIVGRDIFSEVSVSNLVLTNSYWNTNLLYKNYSLPPNTNAMLIITIFAPIVAKVASINITNVYKLVFPLLISLIPLGLYKLFEKQTNKQIAFLAAFLFIIMGFYNVFLVSVKQAMATFFIVLLTLCFLRKNNIKMAFLSVVFMLSIVVSHYGTTYLFIFCLFVGGLIIWLIQKNQKLNNLILISKFRDIKLESHKNRISFTLILLFITFSLAWYIYVSNSSVLTTILGIGGHIFETVSEEFLSPQATEGLGMVLTDPATFSGSLQKAIVLMIQFFIVLGLFKVSFKDKMKFNLEFMAIALPTFLLDIFAVIIPNFSNVVYTPRLYSMTLIFLAPFAIVGGLYFFDKIRVLSHSWKSKNSIKLLSILLVALFLLQVGFVKEVVNDPGTSISLSKEQMMNSDIQHRASFYADYGIFEQNYYSINWLSNNMKNSTIYSDKTSSTALSSYNINLMLNWREYRPQKMGLNKLNYFYLSYSNVKGDLWLNSANSVTQWSKPQEIQEIQPLFVGLNEIYSNGAAQIFYT